MRKQSRLDLAHRVVLGCALAVDRDRTTIRARVETIDETGHARIHEVAAAHGLRPAIAWCLSTADAEVRPSAPVNFDESNSVVRANCGRERLLTGELLRICEALDRAGIPAIPFKGPSFQRALGSAAGLREITDLDLLVRKDRLQAATQALIRLGFEPTLPTHLLDYPHLDRITPEWQLLRRSDELLIELHCRLAPWWFPAPCAIDDIEVSQLALTIAGRVVRWPAPETLLLLHIADGMKSCGRGMKWIADVARILRAYPDLDWAHVARVAKRHGGLNVVRVALALVDDCCNEVAESLRVSRLNFQASPKAELLAADARRSPRLATVIKQARNAIQRDASLPGAMAHFLWSIRVSDSPGRTIWTIVRYLAGPALTDLAQAPSAGRVLPLAAKAFLRRLRTVAGLKH